MFCAKVTQTTLCRLPSPDRPGLSFAQQLQKSRWVSRGCPNHTAAVILFGHPQDAAVPLLAILDKRQNLSLLLRSINASNLNCRDNETCSSIGGPWVVVVPAQPVEWWIVSLHLTGQAIRCHSSSVAPMSGGEDASYHWVCGREGWAVSRQLHQLDRHRRYYLGELSLNCTVQLRKQTGGVPWSEDCSDEGFGQSSLEAPLLRHPHLRLQGPGVPATTTATEVVFRLCTAAAHGYL